MTGGAFLVLLGLIYAAAHGVRLALAGGQRDADPRAEATVTVLQPILSGDPALAHCLAPGPEQAPNAQFVWLVDDDDAEGRAVAQRLAAGQGNVTVVSGQPPVDGENPKTLKLIRGQDRGITTDVVAVLDDDTTLPDGALGRLAAIAKIHGGLATALPSWGRAPMTAAEALVAGFVDGQGASAYLSMARLGRNRTINGMAYAVPLDELGRLGGFAAMGHGVTDDWAIARLFQSGGRPILQTTVPARVAVSVQGIAQATGLLRRWTIFAHRYIRANLDGAMVALVLVPGVLPLVGLVLATFLGAWAVGAWVALLWARAALHLRLVRQIGGAGAAPLWAVVLAELALPVLSVAAAIRPNAIRWRSRRMRLDGGGIRYE